MNIQPLFSRSEFHPVVVSPRTDARAEALREYLAGSRNEVEQLLLKHGALLFRGFQLGGAADFRTCAESAGASAFAYTGGNSPRSRVAVDVYTSTEYPATEVISLHNEMSYLPRWPRRLFFFCETPARTGGQTSLAHGRDVMRAVPRSIVAKLREKRLNYIRTLQSTIPLGKSWQATYGTDRREEVEAIAAEQGSTCRWLENGVLRLSTRCEAFTTHPRTGEEIWFNQAEQWHPTALKPTARTMLEGMVGKGNLPHDCEYGDGEPMQAGELAEIRGALDGSKLLFDWQRADLLMIDNVLMMHGRESFTGERKTLAYLSAI